MVTHPKLPIAKRDLIVGPKVVSIVFLIALSLGLFITLGLEIKKIITPPKITLESPQNGELTNNPLLEVRGRAEVGAELSLNGQTITATKNGSFRELLPLQQGLNTINLQARKRYSRLRTLTVQVIYDANKELTYSSN